MRSRRLLAALVASLALSSSVWAREMQRESISGVESMTPSERERYPTQHIEQLPWK
jgi:hypothetical protein